MTLCSRQKSSPFWTMWRPAAVLGIVQQCAATGRSNVKIVDLPSDPRVRMTGYPHHRGDASEDQVHRGLPITARFRCDALRPG
jgi:hypothetical protein